MRLIHLDPGYTEPRDLVRMLRFHPTGRSFVALVGEPEAARDLCWWDLAADARGRLMTADDEEYVRELPPDPAVSGDLELVAHVVEDFDGGVRLRVTDTWAKPMEEKFLYPVGERQRTLVSVAFAPDGGTLLAAMASEPGLPATIEQWDVEDLFADEDDDGGRQEPFELDEACEPTALACSPDGRLLAVGGADGLLRVLRLKPRKDAVLRPEFSYLRGPVEAVGFTPDGKRVLCRQGPNVVVWEIDPWRPAATLPGTPATDFADHPDGRRIAVASADGSVTVWDAATFRPMERFEWGIGAVHAVAFAPDGLTCAAGGERGRVVVWDV